MGVHATIHASRSEDNVWVQGIKCRLLGLEANASTRSPAAGFRNTQGVTDVFIAVYLDGSVEVLAIYALTLKQMSCRSWLGSVLCTGMKTCV